MAFCNYGEFTVAKVGNFVCNFVHFYYAINNLDSIWASYYSSVHSHTPLPDIKTGDDVPFLTPCKVDNSIYDNLLERKWTNV